MTDVVTNLLGATVEIETHEWAYGSQIKLRGVVRALYVCGNELHLMIEGNNILLWAQGAKLMTIAFSMGTIRVMDTAAPAPT